MLTGSRTARRLALAVLLGAALTACQPGAPAQTATEPPQAAGGDQTIPGQSYPEPGAAGTPQATAGATTPTVAAPTAAAPTATVAAPTAAPPATGLLGPEWTVAYSGDLNGDGRGDAIGWIRAANVNPGPTFKQPLYTSYVGPVSQMVIVHGGADGRPQVRFLGTNVRLTAGATVLYSFDAARLPAAFMVKVTPGVPVLLDMIQVNASGEPAAQGIGIRWDSALGAYRISGPGGK